MFCCVRVKELFATGASQIEAGVAVLEHYDANLCTTSIVEQMPVSFKSTCYQSTICLVPPIHLWPSIQGVSGVLDGFHQCSLRCASQIFAESDIQYMLDGRLMSHHSHCNLTFMYSSQVNLIYPFVQDKGLHFAQAAELLANAVSATPPFSVQVTA